MKPQKSIPLHDVLKQNPFTTKESPSQTKSLAERKIPWLFTDFQVEFRFSLTWYTIPWPWKNLFFPDFSLTVATLFSAW